MRWKVEKRGTDGYAITEGKYQIAFVYATMETGKPLEANANLIATTPGLLEELKRMYEAARCMADPEHCLYEQRENVPWGEMARKAKVVLNKAEGE